MTYPPASFPLREGEPEPHSIGTPTYKH